MGSLAERLVDELVARIRGGALGPGARLPTETALAAEFGVSRTVVREAVSRLRAQGLVETRQGSGSRVLGLPDPDGFRLSPGLHYTATDVLDVLDLRVGIEPQAAALAAARIDRVSGRAIQRAMDAFARSVPEHVIEADFAFHRAIAAATGNRFYVELLDALGPVITMLPRTRLSPEHSWDRPEHVDRANREHAAIGEAIIAGDAASARAAMLVHLGAVGRRMERG